MPLSRRLGPGTDHTILLNAEQLSVRDRVLARLDSGEYQLVPAPCFCGQSDGYVIAERDRYGLPVTTVLCPACGLLRTDPYMSSETTRRFYEEDYRDLYTAQGPAALFEGQVTKGRLLAERLLQLSGIEVVFDVGCGAGGLLLPFKDAGCTVAGCDYGEAYLKYGRTHGVELVQGGVLDLLKHTGQQADLVTLIHVAEHFTDLRRELSEVCSAVKPGGLLLIEVPGLKNLHNNAYQGDLMRYLQNAHTYHFTAATLSFVVSSLGFDVISADEQVFLIAQRPEEDAPSPAPPSPSVNTARDVLRFLGDTERAMLQSLAQPS